MKTLRKLFFESKMTWPRVILFAVITAVITAAVLIIPGISDTSVSQIGVSFEAWIFFALIVILNSDKPLEAGLKTFVFFLISQPLIYLFQVPFSWQGWGLFRYYPRWFMITLLTFPGAIIAWFIKKDKWYSGLILSVATAALGVWAVDFGSVLVRQFPKNLAATLFCTVLAFGLIFVLLKDKKARIIALAITVAATAAMLAFTAIRTPHTVTYRFDLEEGHEWRVSDEYGYVGNIEMEDGDTVKVEAKQYGTHEVEFVNENGESTKYVITYEKANGINAEVQDE